MTLSRVLTYQVYCFLSSSFQKCKKTKKDITFITYISMYVQFEFNVFLFLQKLSKFFVTILS